MINLRRLILAGLLFVTGLAHADWASDRAGSAGYVTVTTLASVIDEAVPFCVVYLSDLPAGFWTAMDAASDTDGKTIRVSTSDGSTQLACVPLGVNTGTDTGCLIFLGTGMSASSDVAYRIYVGNAALSMPSASGGMGEQAVFAAYAGVYFPGMDVRDFTAGGRSLTAVGTPTTASSSIEGITAAEFNGTSQYYYYSGTPATNNVPLPLHLSAVFYTDVTNLSSGLVAITRITAGSNDQSLLVADGEFAADRVSSMHRGNGGGIPQPVTSSSFSASTWYTADSTRDALVGTSTVYINGGSAGTSTTTMGAYAGQDRMSIGAVLDNSIGGYLDGRIAWVGIHLTANSANFIATQKQNWDGNLYSVGSWTPNSIAPGTTGWVLFQTAATTTLGADIDWSTVSNALVDDANAATASVPDSQYTEYLNLTNPAYGVTIPTGAPSYSVEIRIKRGNNSGSGRAAEDETIKLILGGTRTGTNKAATGTPWGATASVDYTGAWGITFAGTDFDSAFGVAIRALCTSSGPSTTASVYVAWVKVSWTGTDTTSKTRGFFALAE